MMADAGAHLSPTAAPASVAGSAHPTPAEPACASGLTVGEVSEEELLARIAPALPHAPREVLGNGDDCAVLGTSDGRFVVSTDVLVEGAHFRLDWSTAQEIGRRGAAQNLADIAAMGAVPTAMVVGLVIPTHTPLTWVEGLVQGLGEAARAAGCGVVGGDLSSGEQIVLSITVHGDLEGRDPVTRSGAKPGDLVVHVGDLGCSAAGLALLSSGVMGCPSADPGEPGHATEPGSPEDTTGHGENGLKGESPASAMNRCLEVFRTPAPPLEHGPALARAGASAMMDVSDALVRDCGRIARASGVVVDLDPRAPRIVEAMLALQPVAARLGARADQALSWVFTGGEDHGLLATVPAHAALPEGVSVIGRVRAPGEHEAGAVLVGGQPWAGSVGWDHFRSAQ